MNFERNICIFTGAGFSKAIFDQAIQTEFVHDLLNSAESSTFIRYLSYELKEILKNINDIELVMSHYHNLAYSNLKNEKHYKKYKREIVFLRTAVAIYFREKFKRISDCYENCYKKTITSFFINNKITKNNLFIVSTNYDLGFEKIIDDIFGRNLYYYPGIGEESKNNDKIPIFKLHGSVNWLENRGKFQDSKFRRDPFLVKTDILADVQIRSLKTQFEFSLEYNGDKYTPILLPFFLQKDTWLEGNQGKDWGALFKKTWDKAREYLSKASIFHFFGYSLPAADHYLFSFLYEIFYNKNNDQYKTDVVDISNKTTLVKFFNSISKNNTNLELNKYNNGLIAYFQDSKKI